MKSCIPKPTRPAATLNFVARLHHVALIFAVAFHISLAVAVHADVFNMPAGQTSMQFVTVGNPGNAADTTAGPGSYGFGAVPYTYQIGKYDVTVGQYCQFLNAVAATDTYGLYNSYMGPDYPTVAITQSGSPGSYNYSVTGTYSQGVNCPMFAVSWGDAARFCNWLQNGQPTGPECGTTTETGAYTLNGAVTQSALMAITRNVGAIDFIPSENEWYKAAYYKGGGTNTGYWTYPTQSNTTPSNILDPTGTNNANYYAGTWPNGSYTDPTNLLTPVGAFADSPGPYGTFDMGGDVWQWNEANIEDDFRGLRGGSWADYSLSISLASSNRSGSEPEADDFDFGFRVASSLPEPSSLVLLAIAALATSAYFFRHRRR